MLTDWQGILRYMHLYSARNRKEHCGSLESWYCWTPSVKHRLFLCCCVFFFFFLFFSAICSRDKLFSLLSGLVCIAHPKPAKKICSVLISQGLISGCACKRMLFTTAFHDFIIAQVKVATVK